MGGIVHRIAIGPNELSSLEHEVDGLFNEIKIVRPGLSHNDVIRILVGDGESHVLQGLDESVITNHKGAAPRALSLEELCGGNCAGHEHVIRNVESQPLEFRLDLGRGASGAVGDKHVLFALVLNPLDEINHPRKKTIPVVNHPVHVDEVTLLHQDTLWSPALLGAGIELGGILEDLLGLMAISVLKGISEEVLNLGQNPVELILGPIHGPRLHVLLHEEGLAGKGGNQFIVLLQDLGDGGVIEDRVALEQIGLHILGDQLALGVAFLQITLGAFALKLRKKEEVILSEIEEKKNRRNQREGKKETSSAR